VFNGAMREQSVCVRERRGRYKSLEELRVTLTLADERKARLKMAAREIGSASSIRGYDT